MSLIVIRRIELGAFEPMQISLRNKKKIAENVGATVLCDQVAGFVSPLNRVIK